MNVLFLGNHLLAQRITSVLKREDIDVTYLAELSLAKRQIKQKRFDLVIVDSLLKKAKDIMREISKTNCVPVIIMVDEAKTSWKTISDLNADGFVVENASDTELLARVMALIRRYSVKVNRTMLN